MRRPKRNRTCPLALRQRLADANGGIYLLDDFHQPKQERQATVRHSLNQARSQGGPGKLAPGS